MGPQSAEEGFAAGRKACTSALLEPRWTTQEPRDFDGSLDQNPRHHCWNRVEPHGNHIVSLHLALAIQARASVLALLEPR